MTPRSNEAKKLSVAINIKPLTSLQKLMISPEFDAAIILVIIANCIVMASESPVLETSPLYVVVSNYIFNVRNFTRFSWLWLLHFLYHLQYSLMFAISTADYLHSRISTSNCRFWSTALFFRLLALAGCNCSSYFSFRSDCCDPQSVVGSCARNKFYY